MQFEMAMEDCCAELANTNWIYKTLKEYIYNVLPIQLSTMCIGGVTSEYFISKFNKKIQIIFKDYCNTESCKM